MPNMKSVEYNFKHKLLSQHKKIITLTVIEMEFLVDSYEVHLYL